MSESSGSRANINRRDAVKALLASGTLGLFPKVILGQLSEVDSDAPLFEYLERHRRRDHGYAWHGQDISHLSPTMAVIGCYHVMGRSPPDRDQLARFTWENHPQKVRPLFQERHIFDFQHVQALSWLDEDVSSLREYFAAQEEPRIYDKYYEKHGYPFFQAEVKIFESRRLVGLPIAPQPFVDFLDIRRRGNGSYNNTPAADGGDGNILNTWWGLEALHLLGRSVEERDSLISWLHACQLPSGGFTHQPKPLLGGVDDVAYTWAAIRALHLLGSAPLDRSGCLEYLHTLANADGGFSDRPGWLSNPMATWRALDALVTLGQQSPGMIPRRPRRAKTSLPSGLKVFSAQIESHGSGSPAETVDLAQSLKIHLWGAKNAQPEWTAQVRKLAEAKKAPVTFFLADEEYGTWVDVPGMGTYSHMADLMASADSDIGDPLARESVVSWAEFRERRLKPVQAGNGRLLWQFGQNEELVRMVLDDSSLRGGYAAISSFHFGNIDFTTSEPFLHRWRGQIPYIALQDAHGLEPWWFADMTEGMRTLFLGTEPTWEAWLHALDKNWVAAVRHDYRTEYQTWMHSGSDEVGDFIRKHEQDWRWWNNADIGRPMVSLVAVRPEDALEVGRPERGVTVRVRCAWRNNNHGLLRHPLSELVELKIDGEKVEPELVSRKSARVPTLLEEHFHALHLPNFVPGKHTAVAMVRWVETGELSSRSIEF